MLKNVAVVSNVSIEPMNFNGKKEFVMFATIVEDTTRNYFHSGDRIRSSAIIGVDSAEGVVETLNTLYHVENW